MSVENNIPSQVFGNRFAEAMAKAKPAEKPAAEPAPAAPPKKGADAPPAPAAKPLVPDLTAPQKPATAPAEPKEPAVKEEPMPPKGSKEYNFRLLESERNKFQKLSDELQAKVADLEAKMAVQVKPGDNAELKTLQERLAQAEEVVSRFALEQDPRFQAAYNNKMSEALKDAKDAVEPEFHDRLETILQMPEGKHKDAALKEFALDVDEVARTTVLQAARDIKKLNREKADALAKSKENIKSVKEYQEKQENELKSKSQAERLAAADNAIIEASKAFDDFQVLDGNTDHNATVKNNIDNVRQWMTSSLNPQDQAKLFVWAVRGINSADREARMQAIITKQEMALKELQGAQPNLGQSSSEHTPVESSGPPDINTASRKMSDRFQKALRGEIG